MKALLALVGGGVAAAFLIGNMTGSFAPRLADQVAPIEITTVSSDDDRRSFDVDETFEPDASSFEPDESEGPDDSNGDNSGPGGGDDDNSGPGGGDDDNSGPGSGDSGDDETPRPSASPEPTETP